MKRSPFIHLFIAFALFLQTLGSGPAHGSEFVLPQPGVMVHLSPAYLPPVLKGIKVNPNNPFKFEFILDKGETNNADLKDEANKLIKYFLASLTVPEFELWVNLSPYEKNRIIPQGFGTTEMGRDLLSEDYLLKQITASLMHPDDEIGKKFWQRIYIEASQKLNTTNIPVNTFNKVWIVPEKAVVYENAKSGTAYVIESKLKVMLEEDYLAKSRDRHDFVQSKIPQEKTRVSPDFSETVRQIIIPVLTKEVNEGKNFAQLRQVYHSLILANWYKKKIKDSILSQMYADKNKVRGLAINERSPEEVYQRYLQALKKGAYNLIKEERDPDTNQVVPRRYFAGGMDMTHFSSVADIIESVAVLNNAPVDGMMKVDINLKSSVEDNALRLELNDAQKEVLKKDLKLNLETLNHFIRGKFAPFTYKQQEFLLFNDPNGMGGFETLKTILSSSAFKDLPDKMEDQLNLKIPPPTLQDLNKLMDYVKATGIVQDQFEFGKILNETHFVIDPHILDRDQYIQILGYIQDHLIDREELTQKDLNAFNQAMSFYKINKGIVIPYEQIITMMDFLKKYEFLNQNEYEHLKMHLDGLFEVLKKVHDKEEEASSDYLLQLPIIDNSNMRLKQKLWPNVEEEILEAPLKAKLLEDVRLFEEEKSKTLTGNALRREVDRYRKNQLIELESDLSKKMLEPKSYDLKIKVEQELQKRMRRLISQYYSHVEPINDVLTRVFLRLGDYVEPSQYEFIKNLDQHFQVRVLKRGFLVNDQGEFKSVGDISPGEVKEISSTLNENDLIGFFKFNPKKAFELFYQSLENDAQLSPTILRAIKNADISPTDLRAITTLFVKILSFKGKISITLLQMHEAGLLKFILPDLAGMDTIYGETWHRFPITHHTIFLMYALEYLDRFESQIASDTKISDFPYVIPALQEIKKQYNEIQSSDEPIQSVSRLMLRLGILNHDAEKEFENVQYMEPHPLKGSTILVPKIFDTFRIHSAEMQRVVSWLVWYHQQLSGMAKETQNMDILYQDLFDILRLGRGKNDPELTPDLWKLLYFLTTADGLSVDPSSASGFLLSKNKFPRIALYNMELTKYWNASKEEQAQIKEEWKRKSLDQKKSIQEDLKLSLFGRRRVHPGNITQIEGAFKSAIDRMKLSEDKNIMAVLSENFDNPENFNRIYNEYTESLPSSYLRKLTSYQIIPQLINYVISKYESQHNTPLTSRTSVSALQTGYGSMLEIVTQLNRDAPGMLYKISGVLAAMGFSIMDAYIQTSREGVITDRFYGYLLAEAPSPKLILQQLKTRGFALNVDEEHVDWDQLLPILIDLVTKDQLSNDDLFAFKGAINVFKRLNPAVANEQFIKFHELEKSINGSSSQSILQFEMPDRNGLLYSLSRILTARSEVNIEVVPIETSHKGAFDEFYVWKKVGKDKRKRLNQKEKFEIVDFFKAFYLWDDITNEDVRKATLKVRKVKSVNDILKNTGLPFSKAQEEKAAALINEAMSDQWLHTIPKNEVIEGNSIGMLRIVSLEKFALLVRQDNAALSEEDSEDDRNGQKMRSLDRAFRRLLNNDHVIRHNASIDIRDSYQNSRDLDAIINNFMNPRYVQRQVDELRKRMTISHRVIRRIGRLETLHSLGMALVIQKMGSGPVSKFGNQQESDLKRIRDRLNAEADQWLTKNGLTLNSEEVKIGTPFEQKLLAKYNLGHPQEKFQDEPYPALTLFEHLRLIILASNRPDLLEEDQRISALLSLQQIFPQNNQNEVGELALYAPLNLDPHLREIIREQIKPAVPLTYDTNVYSGKEIYVDSDATDTLIIENQPDDIMVKSLVEHNLHYSADINLKARQALELMISDAYAEFKADPHYSTLDAFNRLLAGGYHISIDAGSHNIDYKVPSVSLEDIQMHVQKHALNPKLSKVFDEVRRRMNASNSPITLTVITRTAQEITDAFFNRKDIKDQLGQMGIKKIRVLGAVEGKQAPIHKNRIWTFPGPDMYYLGDNKEDAEFGKYSEGYINVQKFNDEAQVVQKNGGIDLTSSPVEVKSSGHNIEFNIDPITLEQFKNAPGLIPEIISIEPLKNVPEFLGATSP